MKKILIPFLAIFLCLISSILSYAEKISTDLKENIFRIHIIAYSDNIQDQKLKLQIRDNILNYFSKQNLSFSNIEECIEYYNNNIGKINEIVQNTLDEYGFNYGFSSKICKSYFPKKDYDYFSLPTGTYNCLKIELGAASGQNWWCVLYPNLCITDLNTTQESKTLLENTVSTASYNAITNNISYKFKIVEYIQKLKY